MSILVTGGTGFIGSNVAKLLLVQGERVVVYDRAPDNASMRRVLSAEEIARLTIVEGDILDLPRLFETVASQHVERIVHLAYLLSTATAANPWQASRINVDGTNNVLEVARQRGVRRVVWASSIAVFGRQESYPPGPIANDAMHDPQSLYGACKSFNERMARVYHEKWGLDTIGLRFGSGYGPGRYGGFAGWTAELIEKPALGQPAVVPFGEEIINWCYVEDDARAILAALRAERHSVLAYNCTGEARPMRDAVAYVKTLFPAAQIEVRPGRFVMAHEFDRSLAAADLGWTPRFSMEQGIRTYVNLVRAGHGLPAV
ncbi:MAG: NAD(P)-dependent oxidoreductase [Chloroflexi bacterium]|nr:NAD(P)-dependent oxidoreductase [Chloroflexota bacterium]